VISYLIAAARNSQPKQLDRKQETAEEAQE
jgi:hypothetical protein